MLTESYNQLISHIYIIEFYQKPNKYLVVDLFALKLSLP